jgi:hypothetical protein
LEATACVKLPASWAKITINGTGSSVSSKGDANGSSASNMNGHVNGGEISEANGCRNGHTSNPIPLSKTYTDDIAVRTVYGRIPLKYALHWPIFASYDELSGCAQWMGGRIPTAEEARSIYSYVDGLKVKEAEQHLGKTVPAVNGFAAQSTLLMLDADVV